MQKFVLFFLNYTSSEMQLAIKKNLKIGGGSGMPWLPAGCLGNAPCEGPGQKQHSQKPQGFDILKASNRHYGSLFRN